MRAFPTGLARVSPVLAACLAMVGCGGRAASSQTDPAAVIPAGAPVYVEFSTKPTGQVRADALAAIGKVLHTSDPAGKVRSLIDSAARASHSNIDFARDIEPWLGARAGLYVTNFTRGNPDIAFAFQTSDVAKARATVLAAFRRQGHASAPHSYHGVSYAQVAGANEPAVGAVKGLLVMADPRAFDQVVDAAKTGGLAASARFKTAMSRLPGNRLGAFYVDLGSFLRTALAASSRASGSLGALGGLLPAAQLPPIAVSVQANAQRILFEATSKAGATGGGLLGRALAGAGGATTTPLFAALPADSWAALGIPKVGPSLELAFKSLGGVLGAGALAAQLKQSTGLDLEQDVFSWIGDAAGFVRGTTRSSVDGALVLGETDPAKATIAFGRIVGAITARSKARTQAISLPGAQSAIALSIGSGQPLVLARGEKTVVVAYGRAAAADALHPSATLGDAPVTRSARNALGGYDPQFEIALPQVLALAESAGAGRSQGWARAKPYLDAFSLIASGSKGDGGVVRSRLALGLR